MRSTLHVRPLFLAVCLALWAGAAGATGGTGGTGASDTAAASTGDTGGASTGTGGTGGTGGTDETGVEPSDTGPPQETGGTGAHETIAGTDELGTEETGTDVETLPGEDTAPLRLATTLAREKGGVGCAVPGVALPGPWAIAAVAASLLLRRRAARPPVRALALLAAAAASAPAQAADPPGEPRKGPEVHVLARGMVERWNEPAIASVYKSGTWLGGVGVAVDLLGPLGVDLEAGFARLKGGSSTLELAPLSGLIELTAGSGRADGFLAAGPAWTVFTESGGDTVVDGARLSAELRGGIRVDSGLYRPPLAPAPSTLRRLELELYLARRSRLPGSDGGLKLGAWRASIGVGAVF